MRTIAVINQKGGVGKTTTVANLGAGLAARGRKTCLVDLDPQAHLTLHFGIEPGQVPAGTYEVMTSQAAFRSATVAAAPRLWVCPSVIDLAAAEIELVNAAGREQILRDRIAEQILPYDLVVIDCPPSLGLLTLNALAAADDVIIPLQAHFLALQGLGKLLETASLVQQRINPKLRVSGVMFCMYEGNTRLAAEVTEDIHSFFAAARDTDCPWSQTRIYETVIHRNIKLAECPSFGKPVFEYEPSCRGAQDYRQLADEFLAWLDRRPWTPPDAEAPAELADETEDEDETDREDLEEAAAPAEPTPDATEAESVAPPAEPAEPQPADAQPSVTGPADSEVSLVAEPASEAAVTPQGGPSSGDGQAVETTAPSPGQTAWPTP